MFFGYAAAAMQERRPTCRESTHDHRGERKSVVEIKLEETDRLDWALKQFRRRMIRSGMFKDMRRKRFYEKPSEARKAKAKAAERRRHKDRKRERAASRFGL
jgi:small subunit ribosomal protein S21